MRKILFPIFLLLIDFCHGFGDGGRKEDIWKNISMRISNQKRKLERIHETIENSKDSIRQVCCRCINNLFFSVSQFEKKNKTNFHIFFSFAPFILSIAKSHVESVLFEWIIGNCFGNN